ncbi:transcriptional regulator, TetR family [Pseudomonas sp. UC 17F4]|uniref:TetR/AcrR family transcriptional regulator n=1 Tax=Pseudomonas sp. UC 17F4 TaxID=1855328 RepID=UPI0008923EA8|nr:TetR/AcrR family transcriptional regulator [Pseudomonas sp. UC 17F4]SDQ77606.1 transcriptional regulator, TetR family [Pseudomonas sp. UC 17F4]
MNQRRLRTAPPSKAVNEPRTKPAEVRLEELMAAAQRLFLAKGVEATTISDIVEQAQVAKGTFYHYFPSKQDMLVALGERYTQAFLEQLEQAVEQCAADDWTGRLRAWVHANIATYLKTFAVHDIVYTNHHHHDRSNKARNDILDQLQGILEGGRAAGAWALPQPRISALMIYAAVHGVSDDAIVERLDDCTAFAKSVADACLAMLGAAGNA